MKELQIKFVPLFEQILQKKNDTWISHFSSFIHVFGHTLYKPSVATIYYVM